MTRKRILSWVLALAMCLSLATVSAFAAGESVSKAEWDAEKGVASYELTGLDAASKYMVAVFNNETKQSAGTAYATVENAETYAGELGVDSSVMDTVKVDGKWGIVLMPSGSADIADFKAFEEPTEKVTVTFNRNYTGAPEATKVEIGKGKTVTAPEDVTREGYTLKGWAETANATETLNLETKTFDADTTLYAVWEAAPVMVEVTAPAPIEAVAGRNGGYTFSVEPSPVEAGKPFTVTVNCGSIDAANKDGETVTLSYNGRQYSVPFSAAGTATQQLTAAAGVTAVTASVIPGNNYTVTVVPSTNGTVSATPLNAVSGTIINVSASANSGYTFAGWMILDGNGNLITPIGGERATFTMPSSNVTVSARFKTNDTTTPTTPVTNLPISSGSSGGTSTSGVRTEIATPSGGTPSGTTTPVTPSTGSTGFTDVPAGSWYASSVDWAVGKGITNGVGGNKFDPDGTCTRAQMVTFLWRAAGSPAPSASAQSFSDVPAGAYFENAVKWAVENGVTNGVGDNRFNPDGLVTRAEAVTFLGRYTKGDLSGTPSFSDVPADSWFAGAVNWAVTNNVTNGMGDNQFQPNTTVTRAMAVTFLARANNA